MPLEKTGSMKPKASPSSAQPVAHAARVAQLVVRVLHHRRDALGRAAPVAQAPVVPEVGVELLLGAARRTRAARPPRSPARPRRGPGSGMRQHQPCSSRSVCTLPSNRSGTPSRCACSAVSRRPPSTTGSSSRRPSSRPRPAASTTKSGGPSRPARREALGVEPHALAARHAFEARVARDAARARAHARPRAAERSKRSRGTL